MITTDFFNTQCLYGAAVHDTFVEGKIYPALVITATGMTVGDEDQTPTIITDSPGVQTLTSSDTDVATIVNNKIHAVAAGDVTIKVAVAAIDHYDSAEAETKITITAAPVITTTTSKKQ